VATRDSRLTVDVRGRARRRVRPPVVRELTRQLERAMRAAGADGEVALSLTDDDELLALNRTYADEDHATDVLSFEQARPLLGDIVISVETAARQATEGGRTLTAELVHLAVHGLAHLLGYDHATPREEKVMFGYEAKLRAQAAGRSAITRVRRPPRVLPKRRRR
jgi:probable rRNA maturation factor